MASFVAGRILTEIGFATILGTVSAMTGTASSIYNLLYGITKYSGPGKSKIINTLIKLDIETTVRLVDSLLKEIPKDKMGSVTIKQSIESLHEIIASIEKELSVIFSRLNYNEKIWLKYWRSYDCSNNLDRLNTYKSILDNRLKIFFDLLNIKHELKLNEQEFTITNTQTKELAVLEQYALN
jgi:hypothetical protein